MESEILLVQPYHIKDVALLGQQKACGEEFIFLL